MVRPLGNALLGNALVSSCGLFSLLNHQLLAQLITDLPVVCIAKLAQTCKTLMCFAGLESLWRSKYLLEYSGLEFIGSWKRSFIIQYANKDVTTKCEIGSQNVYSDHLYLIERCLHADLNTICNPTHDNIDRASNLTVSQFIEQYSIPNKPVIITDLVKTWKAHSKWTTEYLLETLGGNGKKKFQAESCNLSFSQYHKYMKSCNEEAPLYLFDKDFCKDTDLGGDFTTPDIFSHNDFFGVLGETRPDYQWLIIGPERSASTFHIDPNSTSAWNAVITGKKKWILYPPHMIPPGVYPHENGSYVTSPLSLPEWYLSFYNASDFSKGKGPIECVCSAGEIIFVPNNWWHAVINLEETIAITQNFVNADNLDNVLSFLKNKGDQISGYCGNDLLQDFTVALEKENCGVYEDYCKRLENGKLISKKKLGNRGTWEKLVSEKSEHFTFGFE